MIQPYTSVSQLPVVNAPPGQTCPILYFPDVTMPGKSFFSPTRLSLALLTLLLGGCASQHTPTTETVAPPPATTTGSTGTTLPNAAAMTPAAKNLRPANWRDLPGWQTDDLGAIWPAFQQSCKVLPKNTPSWRTVCEQGKNINASNPEQVRQFFESQFRPYALVSNEGSNTGLITGYYEAHIRGSRVYGEPYVHPILPVPDDLITIELGEQYPELKGLRLRGRMNGKKVVPYYTRAEIEAEQKKQDKPPLIWTDDPVAFFFMQVQGSGRVLLPDGKQMRLGYGNQNGHPYRSIGKLLIDRGELRPEDATMQGIQQWAKNNPKRVPELLASNPSYVFFKELPASEDGPPGALSVPLTPERSIAIDPRFVPLGAPVFLDTTQPNSNEPLRRLVMAQDTGGAIKGAPRADFFWGFGPRATEQAGRMKQQGRMWVLLPAELAPR